MYSIVMKFLKLVLILMLIGILIIGCSRQEPETIVVGSKDFTEQFILGNMLAVLIESNTDFTVTFNDNMASHVIFSAMGSGLVDVYIDYTGTVYGYYLNKSESKDAQEVYDVTARELMERYNIKTLGKLGFNNTFNIAVRQETAAEFNLRTISDLAEVSQYLIYGGSAEGQSRNDGIPNLKRHYNMTFKDELVYNEGDRYSAIYNDEVQVSEVYATDAQILVYDLVVLEDDKHYYPPYHGVVIIRNEIAEKHPELVELLRKLEGLLTDDIMRGLNYKVDFLEENPRDVAESFLRENGLIR